MASPQQFRWHYAEFDDSDFQIRGRSLFFFLVLTSIILLVTLVFLYARWVCNVDHSPPSAPSDASAPPSRGLDPMTINGLPIVLYRSSDGAECCICIGIFGDGDKVKELPACKHTFHAECVDQWLCKHSSCPLCRTSLSPV